MIKARNECVYKSLEFRQTAVLYAIIDREAFDLCVCACMFKLSVGVFLNALQIATFKVSLGLKFQGDG